MKIPFHLRLLAFATLALPVMATVDDAQSYALEAAQPWVGKGMEIRYDYARGSAVSGRAVRVSYQVFKGNRYWFFAGGSEDGIRMQIAVKDPDGKPIHGSTSTGHNSATFGFTAPATMLVGIEITGRTAPGEAFGWALVYGFQASAHPSASKPQIPEPDTN